MELLNLLTSCFSDECLTFMIFILTISFGGLPYFHPVRIDKMKKIKEGNKTKEIKTRPITKAGVLYIVFIVLMILLGSVKVHRDSIASEALKTNENNLRDTVSHFNGTVNKMIDTMHTYATNFNILKTAAIKQNVGLNKLLQQLKLKGIGVDTNFNVTNYKEAPLVSLEAYGTGKIVG